jgi:hypothetical protein
VLSVFGDESIDESQRRVFAVAGLFGSEAQWDALEVKWKTRTNGIAFHAADCESDQRDYVNFSHAENQTLYKDLTTLLVDSKLVGYGVAIDLVSQNKYLGELLPESPYYKCFGEIVLFFARQAYLSIPQEQVKFTFDQRLETQYNSTFLYDYMATLPEWEHRSYIHQEVSFASRKMVGIQAADLWAREIMKHLDNQIGPKKRDTRRSFIALQDSKRFGANWYVGEYFDGLAKAIAAMDAPSGMGAFQQGAYKEWLTQGRHSDSYAMRIKYVTQRDAIERAKGNPTHFEDVKEFTQGQNPPRRS